MNDTKAISLSLMKSRSLPKSRNTLSQTIVLAQSYGGPTYKRAASHIFKHPEIYPITPEVKSEKDESSPTRLLQAKKKKRNDTRTERKGKSVDPLQTNGNLNPVSPLPACRVATLVSNSSGINLTYRGAGILPILRNQKD